MYRARLLVTFAVTACGGGSNGPAPDGGTCTTVCWAPADRPVTSTMPPPITDITVTDCNTGGLAPKACPSGFACTGMETQPIGTGHTFTRAVCEPTQTPIAPLVFDLPVQQPQGTVRVELDVTLNGGAWPVGPTAGAAGTISLRPRGQGAASTRNLPTQSGELDLDLVPGDYDTSITVGSFADASRYPSLAIGGVLTVVAAGSVRLDFAGQPLSYSLRLDGGSFPPLASGDSVTLQLRGMHGQLVSLIANGPGPAPSGVLVLEPDTYRITLATSSFASPATFPSGEVVLGDPFVIAAANSTVFDVTSFPISGTVRVDAADVPADGNASVRFGSNSFAVTAAPPARYQGRIFAGSYDVVLDTTASRSTAIPPGATRVASGFTAGPATFDVVATTTAFSGAVTLDGAPPPASNVRGVLQLTSAGTATSQFVALAATGPAAWNMRVYTGSYAVSLIASNVFPAYGVPLEASLVIASPVTRSYNVDAGTANLAVLDGTSQPVDAAVSRGTFFLRRAGSSLLAVGIPPNTGPVGVSLVVEPGTWSVEFTTGHDYTGLPIGTTTLGDITVAAGTTTTTTFNTRSATVSGELRRGGQPLAPTQPGHTRGAIDLANRGIGVDLPAAGAATFSFRVFPGVYDLALQCASTCDTTSDAFVYLATGLRYP